MTRKISNYGTENPLVARVSFQWLNLMPWFDLSVAHKNTIGEALLLQVQPRLLAAKEIAAKHLAAAAAGRTKDCDELARAFASEARQALDAFAPAFEPCRGRQVLTLY